jgi:arylsulfatase A-like enzyme
VISAWLTTGTGSAIIFRARAHLIEALGHSRPVFGTLMRFSRASHEKVGAPGRQVRLVPGLFAGAGLAVLWLVGMQAPRATASERPPNVVFIVADDLGYGDLSCQGSPDVRTPNIDSIARAGVRCTSAYVTAPQCTPSRAGFLTGRYQQRFGVEHIQVVPSRNPFGLPAGETTMADALRGAGYRTIGVGKWHLGREEFALPWRRGFDEYVGFLGGARSYTPLLPGTKDPDAVLRRGPAELVAERGFLTDVLTDEAVAAIGRNKDRPFFLYLAYLAPHWPLEAKDEDVARHRNVADPSRRVFLAMMDELDRGVGRVLKALHDNQLDGNTLIFFLSDNGGAPSPPGEPPARPGANKPLERGLNASHNGPLRGVKGEVFEGGIRIPFLVRWDGHVPAGTTYDKPVSALDIFPTALAAAGGTPAPRWKLDGVDLIPYLSGKNEAAPHGALFWRFWGQTAVRAGKWKFVRYTPGAPPLLFDLDADVSERTDVADRHPDVVKRLDADLEAWKAGLVEPLWPAPPAAPNGAVDVAAADGITGWAWDPSRPDVPVRVDVYVDNHLLQTVTADVLREDLRDLGYGNGRHGFVLGLPALLKDGKSHRVRAEHHDTGRPIGEKTWPEPTPKRP